MEIREIKKSDLTDLNKLHNSIAKEKIHWSVNAVRTLEKEKKRFEGYLEKKKKNKKIIFVCIKCRKFVGYTTANRKKGKRNHVWEIGCQVGKEYRKKGVGSALFSKILDYLKKNGAEQVIAWVMEKNKASIGLLNKFGFTEIGRIKKGVKLDETYCDYILFQKSL